MVVKIYRKGGFQSGVEKGVMHADSRDDKNGGLG